MLARKLGCLLFVLSLASPALAVKHARVKHNKQHRPAWFEHRVLLPSHENLLAQNAAIDALGIPRIKDDKTLRSLVREEELVPVTDNQYVRVSAKLEAKRRYCRPWVDLFLQEFGREYYERFGGAIQVNSAVRTVRTQLGLLRWNRNAAPAHGETASAHLAGVAVDLQRRGLTKEQIRFMQQKLLYLSNLGMIVGEEELREPCFHIVVTGEYPYPPSKLDLPASPFPSEIFVVTSNSAEVSDAGLPAAIR